MEYGVIGYPLIHSYSVEIHRLIGPYRYERKELQAEDLPNFFDKRDFLGINVTIPYKQAVIPFLDEIDPEAEEIGAVNTIVNRSGRLIGYNTDLYGMTRMLFRAGINPAEKKVLILGTGGTSLTAFKVCECLHAKKILRLSRTGKAGAISYEEALLHHRDAQILINTTPCGMFPHKETMALDPAAFPLLEAAADAVYNPLCTRFIQRAAEMGVPAAGGLYMLVAQAVRASELFTGIPCSTEEDIFHEVLAEKIKAEGSR